MLLVASFCVIESVKRDMIPLASTSSARAIRHACSSTQQNEYPSPIVEMPREGDVDSSLETVPNTSSELQHAGILTICCLLAIPLTPLQGTKALLRLIRMNDSPDCDHQVKRHGASFGVMD